MSFTIPSLQDLLDRTRRSFRTHLPGSDAFIWPNNVYVSAKVFAGGLFELFGYASYIAKMPFVHLAPDLETLRKHGIELGVPQKPAAPASGTVDFVSDAAIQVDLGAILERSDGVRYIAAEAGAIVGAGTLNIPVSALMDGAAGNAVTGTPLTIVSGVTGDALVEVSDDIFGGLDVEDIESWRSRLLFRKRYPPHGGAASDYVMWASDVSGVTRVFVERLWAGPGTVRVFPLMDDIYANGIPTVDAVERVADHIDIVRPSGALVTVQAATPVVVDIAITGLSPDTTVVREAVLASLKDCFRRRSRVAGSDLKRPGMPFLATEETFSLSWIWQAVAEASGEDRHQITTPTEDVELGAGEIAVLGTVTFA